ncbi:MAG: C25 family cysteine peptidase [Candidatus Thermoplasmatota archaeon]
MKKIFVIAIAFILFPVNFSNEKKISREAFPVIVSDENPFYTLIAVPAAIFYDENVHVKPLLVENFSNPSKAVERFKKLYEMENALIISNRDVVNASIDISKIWKRSDEAIIIKNNIEGYKLGVAIACLGSYKNIPVFVANKIEEIEERLKELGVKRTYVCGDIDGYGEVIKFESIEEINDFMIRFLKEKFGEIKYIVITNPVDIENAMVIKKIEYNFSGKINSGSTLHGLNILKSGFNYSSTHTFRVPYDGFVVIKIELINKDSEDVERWGDRLFLHLSNPDNVTFLYASTAGGVPEIDENGNITIDKLTYQTCVFNKPGEYTAEVIGTWIVKRQGEYEMKIEVEKVDRGNFPLMKGLSSLASYIASYHKGIVFADDFSFVGGKNADIEGIIYPVSNEKLVEPCNKHVLKIHEKINLLLMNISGIRNLKDLQKYYADNSSHIAIMGDTTMIPMFYYHNPDSDYVSGQGTASDFIYGNIDPNFADLENDSFTYYPFQENAVGRITGYDAQDCSALIARTIFYNYIIDKLGEWKNNATVQTGTGIEFQMIPIISPLMNILKIFMGFGPVRNEPTKFPTGESKFINARISNDFSRNGFNVFSAKGLDAQRVGLLLNRKGGQHQLNSNYIFAFNHGTYYLYEAGDMLEFDQFGLGLKTGLSGKGSFDVRHVINMEYNPSVAFIESCLVGKIEGLIPENCLSQTYIHAGLNSFIASTRYTADPGYLEPGLIFKGFGIYGYINASINLKMHEKYPDLHFGALLAEDFIIDLIENNSSVGIALRNAKNKYLPKDANSTFLWTPPLYFSGDPFEKIGWNFQPEETNALDKKYVCLHEFTLYGDPAFNPC